MGVSFGVTSTGCFVDVGDCSRVEEKLQKPEAVSDGRCTGGVGRSVIGRPSGDWRDARKENGLGRWLKISAVDGELVRFGNGMWRGGAVHVVCADGDVKTFPVLEGRYCESASRDLQSSDMGEKQGVVG
nr:hypothetical protein Iba_chr14bCG10380 [Ipomoea batatas]